MELVSYHVYNILPHVHVLSKINPVHAPLIPLPEDPS